MGDFNERSRTAYNSKADGYDSSREGQFTRNIHRLLLPSIKWQETQSVLDVACGNGSFLAAMNEMKPVRGFGIDISERMIEHAAARNPAMRFFVSGCDTIPFQDDTMDIITVCAAYHHFPDTAAFAKEAGRVLRPNGMLYIADMYLPGFMRLLLNPVVPLLFKDGDVRFYSPREIISNFKRFGFVEAEVKISGNIQITSMRKG